MLTESCQFHHKLHSAGIADSQTLGFKEATRKRSYFKVVQLEVQEDTNGVLRRGGMTTARDATISSMVQN